MYSLKEQAIRDYLSKVNFKSDWNYKELEESMRRFLGERPLMDVIYNKDVVINESTGDAKEIKKLEKISVIFTDTDDRIKKIEIPID